MLLRPHSDRPYIARLRALLPCLAGWLGLALLFLGLSVPPALARNASLLIDAETGRVLQSQQANALWYPASLTKLMTAYMVFQAVEAGKIGWEDKITVSAYAAGQSPTKFGLKTGQKITIEQALKAMLVVSGNDAAVALAEAIGGSEETFAQMMTATARNIGMERSVFRNASGLPDSGQVTTAHDMAVLAMRIINNYGQHYHLFSLRSITIAGRTQGTVNGILSSYPGADGMKTGFTCGSGYNLVASAKRDGRRLIGVILGGRNRGERASLMTALLNSGFSKKGKDGLSLADLAIQISTAEQGPPPVLLNGGECGATVADDGTSTITSSARLSGWGVVFGSFPKRDLAEATVAKMKKQLTGTIGKGRPAIIEKTWEGVSRYSALLVGMEQGDAGKACKKVWEDKGYCLALSPAVLTNPNAEWR
ncbi:D-alanyl-D-alanine carboxypeptidase family protein [Dongia sp.]|uniref:D-alanyl-D-alanine carboxypeptidase family protein n=1 Tax=Dongia sp. TaxID=1977262 RepID=UPI0035B3AEA4